MFYPVLVFAWEAYERGSEVHLQADPTKLELLHNSFKVKKEDFKEKQRDGILEKVHIWCQFLAAAVKFTSHSAKWK